MSREAHSTAQESCFITIDLFTATAVILILPPAHPIVLFEIYLLFCSDNAALSQ